MDARKSTLTGSEALALLGEADELYSTRGRKVVHVDLKRQRPALEELKALVLGPTGNLRAPALRVGRTLVVGFDEATYRRVFGV